MKKLLLPLLCLTSIAMVGCANTSTTPNTCGSNTVIIESISYDTDWQTLDFSNQNVKIELTIYVDGNYVSYSNSSTGYSTVEYRYISCETHSEMTVKLNSTMQKPVVINFVGKNITYAILTFDRT